MAAMTPDQHQQLALQLGMMAAALPFASEKLREAAENMRRVAELADNLATLSKELARIVGEPPQPAPTRPTLTVVPSAQRVDGDA